MRSDQQNTHCRASGTKAEHKFGESDLAIFFVFRAPTFLTLNGITTGDTLQLKSFCPKAVTKEETAVATQL